MAFVLNDFGSLFWRELEVGERVVLRTSLRSYEFEMDKTGYLKLVTDLAATPIALQDLVRRNREKQEILCADPETGLYADIAMEEMGVYIYLEGNMLWRQRPPYFYPKAPCAKWDQCEKFPCDTLSKIEYVAPPESATAPDPEKESA